MKISIGFYDEKKFIFLVLNYSAWAESNTDFSTYILFGTLSATITGIISFKCSFCLPI